MPKERYRLTIDLPPDHFIWSLPSGVRSIVARECLELGKQQKQIFDGIQRIEEALSGRVVVAAKDPMEYTLPQSVRKASSTERGQHAAKGEQDESEMSTSMGSVFAGFTDDDDL